jgi:hypothetical protein
MIEIMFWANVHHAQSSLAKIILPRIFKTNDMNPDINDEKFIPKGAMAFFVLLVLLCTIIWYGIYFLMLSRN